MSATANRLNRNDLRRLRVALLSGATLVVGHAAVAQQTTDVTAPMTLKTDYFGYGASVSPRVSYSDNVNLAPSGFEQDELFLSTVFTANGIYATKRVAALVTGDLDLSYLTNRGEFNVNQNIGALASFMFVDDLFYVDVAGSTARQLIGDNARFSRNAVAGRNQRVDVHTLSLSPYVQKSFADKSEAAARYRLSQTWFGDVDRTTFLTTDPDFVGGDVPNSSRSHEVSAAYNTGSAFNRLKLGVAAFGSDNTEQGSVFAPSIGFRQGSLLGEVEFAVSERFALTGAGGYDEITSDSIDQFFDLDELSGVFWRAGFRARPGRRTDIKLEYGERYNNEFITGAVSYDISRRFRFTAEAGQQFRSRSQTVQSGFRSFGQNAFEFADSLREASAAGEIGLSPEGIISAATQVDDRFRAQSIGIAVSQQASAGLIGIFDRTTISARGFYADDDFGFRQIKTVGGGLAVQHQLSRKASAYGDLFYRRADTSIEIDECLTRPFLFGLDTTSPTFDAAVSCANLAAVQGVSNTVGGRLGGRYSIYSNVSAFAEVGHTTRFSPIPQLEYGENYISGGLILDF